MNDNKQGLGRIALKRQVVSIAREPFSATEQELRRLSEQHKTPALDLARLRIPLDLLELMPRETADLHCLLPVRAKENSLLVAMANPGNSQIIDELSFVTGKDIVPYVAPMEDLEEMISRAYLGHRRGERYCDGPRFVAPPNSSGKLAASPADAPGAEPESSTPLELAPSLEGAMSQPQPPPSVSDAALNPGRRPASAPPATKQSPGSAQARAVPKEVEPDDHPMIEIPDLDLGGPVETQQRAPQPKVAQPDAFEFDDDGPVGPSLSLSLDQQPPLEAQARRQVASRNKRALIVDADTEAAGSLQRMLQEDGYEVSVASDSESALSMLKSVGPDVLLLELGLPKIHGFEIIRRLRGSRRFANLPVVVVTGSFHGWRYAEDLRATAGVKHYLTKPVDQRRVLRSVAQALELPQDSPEMSGEAAQALQRGVQAYKAGDLDTALEHLERGVRADPLAHQIHFQLGLLYGKCGRPFEAVGSLEQALELDPRNFAAAKNLAVLYQKAGFQHKSAEMWERALGLAPDDPTKESIREHLRRLF